MAPLKAGRRVLTVVTRLTVGGEGTEVTEAVDTVEQGEDKEGDEKPDKEVDIESVVSCQWKHELQGEVKNIPAPNTVKSKNPEKLH